MTKHIDIYNLTTIEQFRHRVQTSVFLMSRNILNEGFPSSEMFNPRYNLARQAAALDELTLSKFAWECAANPSIASAELANPGSALDGDIDYVVSSAWNSIAGA